MDPHISILSSAAVLRVRAKRLVPKPVNGVASGLFHSEATLSLPRPLMVLELPSAFAQPFPLPEK